jgi:hypothetical protein
MPFGGAAKEEELLKNPVVLVQGFHCPLNSLWPVLFIFVVLLFLIM